MASISFTCPHCDKLLRTSSRPAAGKKIKCPACGDAFVPTFEDEEEGAAIQEKPKPKTPVKASSTSVSEKKPRRDEVEHSQKKAKRTVDDQDDDDADDDQPAKKSKKGKKKAGGSKTVLLFALAGGGVFLLLGACIIGAFVWPGFLNSNQKLAQAGPPKEKAVVILDSNSIGEFVSPQSSFLIGANTKSLREKNQLDAIVKNLEGRSPPNQKMPPELLELFRNSDRILVSSALHQGRKDQFVAVLAPTPDVIAKLKSMPQIGPEEMLAGKYRIHRSTADSVSVPKLFVFPGDRSVLLSDLNDDEILQILDPVYNKQLKPCPAAGLSKAVEQSHLWGAWAFDDEARLLFNDPGDLGKQAPDLQKMIPVLQQAKGSTLAANFENGKWSIRINVECANNNDAKTLKDGADSTRASLTKMLELLVAFGQAPPSAVKDLNSIQIQSAEATTTLSAQVSSQTIFDLGAKKTVDPKKTKGK